MVLVDDVRAALDRGDLFLEYLPIVSLADSRCVGAETLARWPQRDIIQADGGLLPEIANTPLGGRITYWVIETVASELGVWLDRHPEAHVSINVPPAILGRGGIEYAAVRSGLRSRYRQIVLEIGEHGVPDRLGLEALNMAAQRGLRVSLDDSMLTGAHMALLARSNISMIKLDRRVTAQLGPELAPAEWLRLLRAVIENSALEVVAEGIENDYQVKWLRAAGVQMAQGPHFSGPLRADALQKLYEEDRRPGVRF